MLGLHHFYFGLLAIFLAWFGMWRDWAVWLFVLLFVIGAWLCADDLYQHWRQRRELDWWDKNGIEGKMSPMKLRLYHSPVHRLYQYLFGWLHKRVVRLWRG